MMIMKKKYIKPEILLDTIDMAAGVMLEMSVTNTPYEGGDGENLSKPFSFQRESPKAKNLWADDDLED